MDQIYDVAVIGAGPGGSAAAHFLAKSGLQVLLLDKSDFPRDKTCGDGLTPRALHVLDEMGILPQVRKAGFQINGLELHARSGVQLETPIPEHPEYPNHLLIVPRLKLDDIIRRRAIASGAHFESPVRVTGIEHTSDHVKLKTRSMGQSPEYRAKLIIVAIGANLRLLQDWAILKKMPKVILAARAYFTNMTGLKDRVEAHFADVPLPGYGWVFPTSESSANIGLGYWSALSPFSKRPSSVRSEMERFLEGPKIRPMLEGAEMQGSIKSYPLRIDFNSAPTFGERVLLVGESAGLVSPLTGEGIDFALESGKLAAQFIIDKLPKGDFSHSVLVEYDRVLRDNFQSIFRFLGIVRRFYINPLLMDRTISASERNPEIKRLLINVLMSQQHPSDLINPKVVRRILLGV